MTVLRSTLFALVMVLYTPLYSVVALMSAPLPRLARYRVISGWARSMLWVAAWLLRLRYEVEGLERFPRRPAIILSKHQSAWETLAFQCIFPPHVQVLKRSLLWIPFFGWGLALMSPISIDRSRGIAAAKRMAEQGAARLAQGFCIVLYPEGTRTRPGMRAKYHVGGAWLAVKTGAPVVPVAHNAGLFWGKDAFLKRPGVIRVLVGEPISPQGMTPDALNEKVERWIEARMETLCPGT
jgi:1-acyl-sn-glycerol-3-phosphate acyltransferase